MNTCEFFIFKFSSKPEIKTFKYCKTFNRPVFERNSIGFVSAVDTFLGNFAFHQRRLSSREISFSVQRRESAKIISPRCDFSQFCPTFLCNWNVFFFHRINIIILFPFLIFLSHRSFYIIFYRALKAIRPILLHFVYARKAQD